MEPALPAPSSAGSDLALICSGDETDVTLDFATSIVSSGKVVVKANRREKMAPGHLIDPQGNPTTDPGVSSFFPSW